MPKCRLCGKRGLFLKLTNNLCPNCATTVQRQWTESQAATDASIFYDFSTLEGIGSIPVSDTSNIFTMDGITGDISYHLRQRSYAHEDAGNIDLALACLRKSIAIKKAKMSYIPEDGYTLVKMLARAGYIEEAQKEKEQIDHSITQASSSIDRDLIKQAISLAHDFDTDYLIMSVHNHACSECAKYQGRVYSISGKSNLFPKLPTFLLETGVVHEGCSHHLAPYIHEVDDPQLEYTLELHPLQNKAYGSDIIAFSNRPFVDDRTDECKQAAEELQQQLDEESAKQRYYSDHMIEIEAKRGQEAKDFRWLQENLAAKCPKSLTGFRRMKTQNTKNYQMLKSLAAELGREI